MTEISIHPSLQKRRQDVQSERERRYDTARSKMTNDLKRAIDILTVVKERTKSDLVKTHIDLAWLLYQTVEKTPPRSPLSDGVCVGIQHLQNGMVFLENMAQRSALHAGSSSDPNKEEVYEFPTIQTEFLRQERVLREHIDSFMETAN